MLRRLNNLAIRLDSMGLKKEAGIINGLLDEFLNKESRVKIASVTGEVFMHIGGPSGSGKSTLMEEIQAMNPQAICKDLDELDEEATEALGLSSGWKNAGEYTDELAEEHFKVKQSLLDNFINSHSGEKIILVGIHSEGDHTLNFHPQYKILLNTSSAESLRRRIKRDKKMGGSWEFWKDKDLMDSELRESEKIIQDLQSADYLSLSAEEVLDLLKKKQ